MKYSQTPRSQGGLGELSIPLIADLGKVRKKEYSRPFQLVMEYLLMTPQMVIMELLSEALLLLERQESLDIIQSMIFQLDEMSMKY
jgi:hypothetical protein